MNQIDIQVAGTPELVKDDALIDKLKEILVKLLRNTPVTSCTLTLVRVVAYEVGDAPADIVIHHPVDAGLQILIQDNNQQPPQRYRCILDWDAHSAESLQEQLIDAIKNTTDIKVRYSRTSKYSGRPKKKRGKENSTFLSGIASDNKKIRQVMLIALSCSVKGRFLAKEFSNRMMSELKLTCAKKAVGNVFRILRHAGLIKAADDYTQPHEYIITSRGENVLREIEPNQIITAASSPLQRKVAKWEADALRHAEIIKEIATLNERLSQLSAESESLLPSIRAIEKIMKETDDKPADIQSVRLDNAAQILQGL